MATLKDSNRPTRARKGRATQLNQAATPSMVGGEEAAVIPAETVRAVLRQVSEWSTHLEQNDEDFSAEDLWSMRNTQVNTDIALALECEAEGDITEDDLENGFMLFPDSPAYQNLRQRFIEDATQRGSCYSFQFAVWRAYNAGRLSPVRLEPDTRKQRQERRETVAMARRVMEMERARR